MRPAWAPPAWLFGAAWSVLYVLMATSAWLVWRRFGFRDAGTALTLFVVQLAMNALWTWLFFAWRQGGIALAELSALWVMIVVMIAMFWKLHRTAGALLVPYLCWVSFAGVLNFTLWRLNPAVLQRSCGEERDDLHSRMRRGHLPFVLPAFLIAARVRAQTVSHCRVPPNAAKCAVTVPPAAAGPSASPD